MIASSPTSSAERIQPAGSSAAQSLNFRPNVDVATCDDSLVFVADIPGSSASASDVQVEDGVLSIDAAVPARSLPGTAVRREYGIGGYQRSFQIGADFDASQIAATYRNGVLTIRVPRLTAEQPHTIPVTAG